MTNKWWVPFILVLMIMGFTGSAKAHEIQIERSNPAADSILEGSPEVVTLWFSEEIQSDGSTLKVFNEKGEQVDNQDGGVDLNDPAHASMRVTLPRLPGGAYTVRWHAVLLDGDESEGEFGFFIGTAAEATEQASEPSSGGDASRCLIGGLGGVFIFLAVVAFPWNKALHRSRM